MPSIAGLSRDDLRLHIVSASIDDVSVQVPDPPGLLRTKQGLRPKDRMDAAVISAALQALERQAGDDGEAGEDR